MSLKQNLIPSWPWSFWHTSCISDFRCKTKYTNKICYRTPGPAYLAILPVLVIFCPLGPTNFKKSEKDCDIFFWCHHYNKLEGEGVYIDFSIKTNPPSILRKKSPLSSIMQKHLRFNIYIFVIFFLKPHQENNRWIQYFGIAEVFFLESYQWLHNNNSVVHDYLVTGLCNATLLAL